MAGGAESNNGAVLSPVELMLRYLDSLPQQFSPREEIKSPKFWKALRAEFLCSLLLVVFLGGCVQSPSISQTGACDTGASGHLCNQTSTAQSVGGPSPAAPSAEKLSLTPAPPNLQSSSSSSSGELTTLRVSLAYALTVTALLQCFGNVSGAQTSPAVTVSLLVTRHISPLRAGAYLAVQLLGALVAGLITLGLTPPGWPPQSQALTVARGVTVTQAFGVEFLATLVPVITTLAVLDPARRDVGCRALAVGLAYGSGALFAFQKTGAGMNPARALGPAVVSGVWTSHWVYWAGPVFGGILGGFTYEFVHDSSPHGSYLRRSFRRRRPGTPGDRDLTRPDRLACRSRLERDVSGLSSATTDAPHLQQTEDLSIVSRH